MATKQEFVKIEIELNSADADEKMLIAWQCQFLNPGEQIKKVLLGKELPPSQSLRDEVARLVKEILGAQALQAAAPLSQAGEEAEGDNPSEIFPEEIKAENEESISEDAIRESLLRAFD